MCMCHISSISGSCINMFKCTAITVSFVFHFAVVPVLGLHYTPASTLGLMLDFDNINIIINWTLLLWLSLSFQVTNLSPNIRPTCRTTEVIVRGHHSIKGFFIWKNYLVHFLSAELSYSASRKIFIPLAIRPKHKCFYSRQYSRGIHETYTRIIFWLVTTVMLEQVAYFINSTWTLYYSRKYLGLHDPCEAIGKCSSMVKFK